MAREITLVSVGIDIGTTTTQLVISRLTLANVMPGSQVPKVEVCHKSITYVGDIHFTPFVDRQHVDGAALRHIVAGEYAKAGVSPAGIDTGAIIITGETAKKENAAEIIHSLADYAGDFVVATAGPDLESLIAGKGSGAEDLSRRRHAVIANLDIGGGTTNIAYFDRGKCIGTACINVGGRLFEVNPLTHRLSFIAPPASKVLDSLALGGIGRFTAKDAAAELAGVREALRVMVECVDKVIYHEPLSGVEQQLVMTDSLPPVALDGVVFSGGVAKYIYLPGMTEWWIHGDVGPLLAEAFRQGRTFQNHRVLAGNETIHATVLGAGAHTVNVSGSTIAVSKDALPLRNVPAVYPEIGRDGRWTWLNAAAGFAASLYRTVALVVPPLARLDFASIGRVADLLAAELPQIPGNPKVVIAQQDIAKVLGQSLESRLGKIPLVCLDGIELGLGDFLDIAKPLPYEEAVPVIIKTLVFAR